jgi:hypothetical protein
MENTVPSPKEKQPSGFAALIAFGIIGTILVGLFAGHPKAAAWIAEAVEAESSKAPGEATSARLADEP